MNNRIVDAVLKVCNMTWTSKEAFPIMLQVCAEAGLSWDETCTAWARLRIECTDKQGTCPLDL